MKNQTLPLAILLAVTSPFAAAQTINIAPSGTATQSSDWVVGAPAADAIDGNTDTDWFAGSIQHTDNDIDAWWRVDFAAPQEMFEIRLFNRGDCAFCGPRLSNFRVSVLDGGAEVWGANFYEGSGAVPTGGMEVIGLPGGTIGTAVRVQFIGTNNSGNGFMHMAEVEIDGREVGSTFCISNPNSTGQVASIRGVGSTVAASNNFGLMALDVPVSQFGFFVGSPNPGNTQIPNNVGVLCLGGPYARFNGQVLQTPDSGFAVGAGIDTSAIPLNVLTPVQPGQTWYFQYWFRDSLGGSNLSNGLMVTFQ